MGAVSFATAVHDPGLEPLHAPHGPQLVLLQQTPFVQLPLVHWPPAPHETPSESRVVHWPEPLQ